MKTTIYSCGKGCTSIELMDNTRYGVDILFPEIVIAGHRRVPLHEHEQLELLPHLIGKSIVTVSETIILMFLREVRTGRMKSANLELYCDGRRIEIDETGSLLDHWDGGFFETGFNLRFA